MQKVNYIAFCDADDTWHKNKLIMNRLNFMRKNNLKFSHIQATIL